MLLVELLLRRVRDSTSNPLSTLYFLGVPVSPVYQRFTMAVAVFDALFIFKAQNYMF